MLAEYVLVHRQIDKKNKHIEHMILEPYVYKKRSRRKRLLKTLQLLYFLKYLL